MLIYMCFTINMGRPMLLILTRSIAGISLFLKVCFKGIPNSNLKQ